MSDQQDLRPDLNQISPIRDFKVHSTRTTSLIGSICKKASSFVLLQK